MRPGSAFIDMILIADSGSTKTDWRLIGDSGNISQLKTAGMNPFYQDSEAMHQELTMHLLPHINRPLDSIFFYGAGCITQEDKEVVRQALLRAFETTNAEVYDDLFAAARALCGPDPGIACILGTGSNSCFYDGHQIIDRVPPLGFILGDEGSGSYLGKRLVADYLKRLMPEILRVRFKERFAAEPQEIMESVYKKEFPNRYLARFSQFAFHNLTHPYIYDLVVRGFSTFLDRNVLSHPNHQDYPIHFVGSIAYYYSDVLRQVASDRGLVVKNILESPIAGLTLYHHQISG